MKAHKVVESIVPLKILTSTLSMGERSASFLGHFTPGETAPGIHVTGH
jgi:hypothetical protein